MLYRVSHNTFYEYENDVSISHNLAHLKARETPSQTCREFSMLTSVPSAVVVDQFDFFGNPVRFFTIQEPHHGLRVESWNLVEVRQRDRIEPANSPPWEEARDLLRHSHEASHLDAYQFCFDSPLIRSVDWLCDYALDSFTPARSLIEAAVDLTRRIHTDFRYDPTATTNTTPIADVFKIRRGVCQDFAHLQIGCLRSLGLAARYVSGYLRTLPPPGQARLVGADASHAWLSVFCPRLGWVDLDPTNNRIPGDQHITLSWGRDYDDVSPIKGVILGGGQHTLRVAVDVIAEEQAVPVGEVQGAPLEL